MSYMGSTTSSLMHRNKKSPPKIVCEIAVNKPTDTKQVGYYFISVSALNYIKKNLHSGKDVQERLHCTLRSVVLIIFIVFLLLMFVKLMISKKLLHHAHAAVATAAYLIINS